MTVHRAPTRATKVPEIRTGDTVVVLGGKDAGKRGVVERVVRNPQGFKKSQAKYGAGFERTSPLATASVVVEGLNVAKRHTKPRQSAGCDRPDAEGPAGRDPRSRPAAADRQGHARLQPLRQADADRPQGPRQRSPRPGLPPLRRAAGGEVVTSRLHERYAAEIAPGTPEAVRVRQPDAGAAAQQDRHQHRPRRGAVERQGARRGPRRPDPHHRPEADRDEGQAVDRPVPPANRQHDRGQGHAPRRADVGLPRSPDDARPAAHPRLPGRSRASRSTAAATTRSGCASSSRSRRSNTTRWTVSAGWRSAS